MPTRKQIFCVLCVTGVTAFSAPPLVSGRTRMDYQQREREVLQHHQSHNLTPTEFFTQAERDLITRVQEHLGVDPALAPIANNLTIEAEVGAISLEGTVPTQADKERLISKVEHIPGVERVNERLRITTSELSAATSLPSREVTNTGMSAAETSVRQERATVSSSPPPPSSSFAATGSRGSAAAGEPAMPGSGQMAKEDRTGSTGPSGSRSTSVLNTGAIDTFGRVTKSAGDEAVTEVDRALASEIRVALRGNPEFAATEENVHLVVNNGIVTLQGWVPSEQDRRAIAERVANQSGVQELHNQLVVQSPTALEAQR